MEWMTFGTDEFGATVMIAGGVLTVLIDFWWTYYRK